MRRTWWFKSALLCTPVALLMGCTGSGYHPADLPPDTRYRRAAIPKHVPRFKPSVERAQERARRAAGRTVTVARGDTLFSLARRVGLPLRDLIDTNGLTPPYTLFVGQRLVLSNPAIHKVRRGETAYSISQYYGLRVGELMQPNRIGPPYTLYVGQELRLPSSRSVARATGGPIPSAAIPASKLTPKRASTPPPRTSNQFSWPVKGRVISRFGRRADGAQNDGINIAAKRGTPILAAEDGVIVYASDALQGYGNLLLIRHGGGWITTYAHADKLLVREGDKVRRGQRVALVGTSGGVEPAQLHFEVRKAKRAVDPLTVLEQAR